MSKVIVERCNTYGFVKTLTVHVDADAVQFLESEMKAADTEIARFAYEYGLGKVQHAHGNGLETCDIMRHKFLASFSARISANEEDSKTAWNELCRPFTS
ncbi:hypothetical protein EON76_00895 [bacterium]|nr:MAG: hypothetical protein EON76_00895 [bacterium]